MTFGRECDEATSAELFQLCREAGVNLFDCANVYVDGRSEEILGGLIADCREEVIVTSKFTGRTGPDVNQGGANARTVRLEIEKSLRRLRTDYIDIYFIHSFDPDADLELTLRALDAVVRQGKAVWIGASNFAAWQVARTLGLSELLNLPKFSVVQPMYSLIKRQAEVELLPLCSAERLGVMCYNPLAGGMLTGKYLGAGAEKGTRFAESEMYRKRYAADWIPASVERFVGWAKERGYHPASLAVAWAAAHPAVTAPIVGARKPEQLRDTLASMQIRLSPEEYREISRLTPEPPPAHDRTEDTA